ncbi:uncharacterized protein LOC142496614 [Ascaphus truei]|uniref:uncharacterized protein LOC142496614 n=1 Tax=Ascaphus truei TaxID=8439 RepID=UPI003F5A5575
MKVAFEVIGFLSALVVSAHSLSCITCVQKASNCDGPAQTCPSQEDVCMSMMVWTEQDRYHVEIIFTRQCGSPRYCAQSGTLTSPSYKIQFVTSCCNTNSCIPANPLIRPDISIIPSSLLCPACDANATTCTAQYAMRCAEEEPQCFTFSETSANGPKTMMGCSTESFCANSGVAQYFKGTKSVVTISCTRAGSATVLPLHYLQYCQKFLQVDSKIITHREPALCSLDQDVCLKENSHILYGGKKSLQEIVQCGKSSECGRRGTISHPEKRITLNTTCCDKSVCFPNKPLLTEEITVKNGLTCESCFSPNTTRCLVNKTMQCAGNETRCIRYTETVTQGQSISYETLQGCSTEEICISGDRSLNYTTKQLEMNITCWTARSSIASSANCVSSIRALHIQQLSVPTIFVSSLLTVIVSR